MRERGSMQYQLEKRSLAVLTRVVALPQTRSFFVASHPLQSFWFFLWLVFGVFTAVFCCLEHVDLVLVLLLLSRNEIGAIFGEVSASEDSHAIFESGVLFALVIKSAFCDSVMLDSRWLVVVSGPTEIFSQRVHDKFPCKLVFYSICSFLANLMLERTSFIGRPLGRLGHDQSFSWAVCLAEALFGVVLVFHVFHVRDDGLGVEAVLLLVCAEFCLVELLASHSSINFSELRDICIAWRVCGLGGVMGHLGTLWFFLSQLWTLELFYHWHCCLLLFLLVFGELNEELLDVVAFVQLAAYFIFDETSIHGNKLVPSACVK